LFHTSLSLDEEDLTVIRRGSGPRAKALTAVMALAALAVAGCGREDAADGTAPATAAMEEGDYVAHVAALTVALEEGLTGAEAEARAIELGGGGHSRAEVEELAALLRERPERWLEVEKEVDGRIADLRRELDGEDGD
jgi:hypothetical protein